MKKNIMIAGVALIVAVAVGGKMYAGNVADKEISKAIASVHAEDMVKYDGVSVGLLGSVTLQSVVFGEHGEMKARSIEVASLDRDALEHKQFPSYGDIRIKGFELSMSDREMKRAFPLLYKLGYHDVHGDLRLEYTYSDDNKIAIDEASLTLDEAGTLELALEVEVGSISNPLELLAALDGAKLSSMSMTLENDGVVDHILALIKHEKNKNKDEILKELEHEASKANKPMQKEVLTAMHDFIDGGDEFKASINPSSPIRIARVVNAIQRGDFNLLSITVKGS